MTFRHISQGLDSRGMKFNVKKCKIEYQFQAQTTISTCQEVEVEEEIGLERDLIHHAIVIVHSLR